MTQVLPRVYVFLIFLWLWSYYHPTRDWKHSADWSRECCGLFLSQLWDKSRWLVLSAVSVILCLLMQRGAVGCLQSDSGVPQLLPQTQSWFPVLKIECNFLECLFFYMYFLNCFTFVLHFVQLSLLIKLLASSLCLCFFCKQKTFFFFFCPILSLNKNKKISLFVRVLTCKSYYNLFICHVIFKNMIIAWRILTSAVIWC